MKALIVLALLALAACSSPLGPSYHAFLAGPFWIVEMPDGTLCRPGPFIRGGLDTPEKAIAVCIRLTH